MKLSFDNLTISYGDKQVISNFCETINAQEKIALMGASGIGKTSLINAIMSLISYEGNIQFDEKPELAVVFQENRLLPDHTIFNNIRIVSKLDNATINKYIKLLKLNPKDYVSTLSGGMKRRVAILRAMLAPSNLIILDEPFKGLDMDTKEIVMSFVKEKASDKTMIIITHDLLEANYFNCRTIELDAFCKQ